MRYVSCPMSQKAAILRQFTYAMSNYDHRPLSRRDTKLNNYYILSEASDIVYEFSERPLIKKLTQKIPCSCNV